MQRRSVVTGLAALPVLAIVRPVLAATSDSLATSGGELGIHPIHHASLVLTFGDQVFYFDPADTSFEGQPPATAIFITHAHPDHFNAAALPALAGADAALIVTEEVAGKLPDELKDRATVMKNGDTGTVNGIPVAAIPAYNTTPERLGYHPQGVGNGYVLTFGDKRVYVAGDTEDIPEMRALTDIAVAFIPMNLPYTMSVEQAADAVKAFRPAIVYPYHYQGSDVEQFKALVGDASEVRLVDWYAAAS